MAPGLEEADALVRNTLSGNAFLGKGFFSNYITKDISLAYGGLFVVVDNFLAPQTHQYDIGAQFTLNLPGTVNLSAYAQKETHHVTQNSICPAGIFGTFYTPPVGTPSASQFACPFTGDQVFKWAPRLELVILEPLTFLPTWLPLSWNSFTGVTFPKGTGLSEANLAAILDAPAGPAGWCFQAATTHNPCSTETKTEVFSENRLVLDIGKMYWGKPGLWEASSATATGTTSSAPITTPVVHLAGAEHLDRKHRLLRNDLPLHQLILAKTGSLGNARPKAGHSLFDGDV